MVVIKLRNAAQAKSAAVVQHLWRGQGVRNARFFAKAPKFSQNLRRSAALGADFRKELGAGTLRLGTNTNTGEPP